MRHYRFALCISSEPEPEYLGAMAFADDGAALAFGEVLVHDLMHYAKMSAPLVVEVIEGERAVGSIPSHRPS